MMKPAVVVSAFLPAALSEICNSDRLSLMQRDVHVNGNFFSEAKSDQKSGWSVVEWFLRESAAFAARSDHTKPEIVLDDGPHHDNGLLQREETTTERLPEDTDIETTAAPGSATDIETTAAPGSETAFASGSGSSELCQSWCNNEMFTRIEHNKTNLKKITGWNMKCTWHQCTQCEQCGNSSLKLLWAHKKKHAGHACEDWCANDVFQTIHFNQTIIKVFTWENKCGWNFCGGCKDCSRIGNDVAQADSNGVAEETASGSDVELEEKKMYRDETTVGPNDETTVGPNDETTVGPDDETTVGPVAPTGTTETS